MEEHRKKGWGVVGDGGEQEGGIGCNIGCRSTGGQDRTWWVMEEHGMAGSNGTQWMTEQHTLEGVWKEGWDIKGWRTTGRDGRWWVTVEHKKG